MNIKKLLNLNVYKLNLKDYKKSLKEDEYALSTFGGGNGILTKGQKKTVEYKAIKLYRFYQINKKIYGDNFHDLRLIIIIKNMVWIFLII